LAISKNKTISSHFKVKRNELFLFYEIKLFIIITLKYLITLIAKTRNSVFSVVHNEHAVTIPYNEKPSTCTARLDTSLIYRMAPKEKNAEKNKKQVAQNKQSLYQILYSYFIPTK